MSTTIDSFAELADPRPLALRKPLRAVGALLACLAAPAAPILLLWLSAAPI